MCGYTGFIDLNNNFYDYEKILQLSANSINFRGPDENKNLIFKDLGIYLTFNRLSMIDLSNSGSQPMQSFSKKSLILFNGEIYNYKQLKKNLNHKKSFSTENSDTRVALEYIEEYGIDNFLKNSHGMFSIVFIDIENKEIFFLSDPFCQKPLYYSLQNNILYFSSDIRTIHFHPNLKKEIDPKVISQFLKKNWIHSPQTIYKNVNKISKGEKISIKFSGKKFSNINKKIYYNYISKIPFSYDQQFSIKQFNELMLESVERHLISDVPISVFLSSGLDSSLVLSLSKQITNNIESHTIGFEINKFDESNDAQKISKYLGIKNNQYILNKTDTLKIIDKLPDIYSEPFSDSSQIPYNYLCSMTSQRFKGVLCGDGGDELFGGYRRHKLGVSLFENRNNPLLSYLLKILSTKFSKRLLDYSKTVYLNEKIDRLIKSLSEDNIHGFYENLTSHFHLNNILNIDDDNKNYTQTEINDNHKLMMLKDLEFFLTNDLMVKSDRASMYNSLEVRSPFLSKKIFEYSAKLDSKVFFKNGYKSPIRDLLHLYLPKKLIQNQKKGFSVPLKEILKNDLKEHLNYYFSDKLLSHGFFKINTIKETIKNFLNGDLESQYAIWDLLMFQMWFDKYHKI